MSTVPGRRRFIGDTIGVHFDRIVERFAERDALIVRHQQVRWTYRELKERVDAFAGGLLALGLKRAPGRDKAADSGSMGSIRSPSARPRACKRSLTSPRR